MLPLSEHKLHSLGTKQTVTQDGICKSSHGSGPQLWHAGYLRRSGTQNQHSWATGQKQEKSIKKRLKISNSHRMGKPFLTSSTEHRITIWIDSKLFPVLKEDKRSQSHKFSWTDNPKKNFRSGERVNQYVSFGPFHFKFNLLKML